MERAGPFWGLLSLFRGFRYLLGAPRSWPWAAAPAALFLVFVAAAGTLAVTWLQPALLEWLDGRAGPRSDGLDWRAWGAQALAWLAALLAMGLGVVVALVLTPPLASPALEKLVEMRERELGVPARRAQGFWYELRCGLEAQFFGLLLFGPPAALCWLGALVLPAAAPFLGPLSMACSFFGVAWNLLDYPLTLRGIDARARFAFLRRHIPTCFGFGAGFAALFWVPCLGVLFLPVGVVAATELVWRLAAKDSDPPEQLRGASVPAPEPSQASGHRLSSDDALG